jgi:hypothetical protein
MSPASHHNSFALYDDVRALLQTDEQRGRILLKTKICYKVISRFINDYHQPRSEGNKLQTWYDQDFCFLEYITQRNVIGVSRTTVLQTSYTKLCDCYNIPEAAADCLTPSRNRSSWPFGLLYRRST